MRIVIENRKENVYTALRKIGYAPHRVAQNTKEISAIRSLARGGFPRFHIYAKADENTLYLNLHLDQKRPSYAGTRAHGGEHDTEAVKKEAERIKQIL